MKIAISATGPSFDDTVAPRFGRCPYYVIVQVDTMTLEPLPNPNCNQAGAVGTQSAQMMAEKGVDLVLTGNCGPKALQAFGMAGIKVITGVSGTIRQAVRPYADAPRTPAAAHATESTSVDTAPLGPQKGGGLGMVGGRLVSGRFMGGRRGMGGGGSQGGGGRGGGPA